MGLVNERSWDPGDDSTCASNYKILSLKGEKGLRGGREKGSSGQVGASKHLRVRACEMTKAMTLVTLRTLKELRMKFDSIESKVEVEERGP